MDSKSIIANSRGQSDSGESATQKVSKALRLIMVSPVTAVEEACALVKGELLAQIDDSHHLDMQQLDSAFLQITKIRQALSASVVKAPSSKPPKVSKRSEAKKLFQQKKYLPALNAFEEEIACGAEDYELILSAGTAALYAKDYLRAEVYADQILRRNKEDLQGLVLKGLANFKTLRYQEALSLFLKAQELQPSSPSIQKYLEEARKALKPIQNWNGERRWKRVNVDDLEIHLGDYACAWASTCRVKSISGGGALVVGNDIPDEVHFTLEWNGRSIWGHASVSYRLAEGVGIRFTHISKADQDYINHQVLKLAALRRKSAHKP